MVNRCDWVNPDNKLYEYYHDNEWWEEVHDDRTLFELLTLEWAQAGLSWETILKRRQWYREAFDDFDVIKISNYDDNKLSELLKDDRVIKNRLKIYSVRKNAKVFVSLQEEFWSFDKYIWSWVNWKQIKNNFKSINDIPANTDLSDKISKDLKKRGMSFVWTTILYAFMQAIWIVNDHHKWCFKYLEK